MPSYLSYMRQMAVLDADDTEIESWITVRGNHIPIKKGQSKEDAVKSFVESKEKEQGKSNGSKQTFYKNISGKQIGSPKGRTFIENEIMTEKEMAKRGFDPTDKRFERKELGKNEHHFFFGARFENAKPESKKEYPAEFETVRKNAKANPYLYDLRYTQKSKAKAYEEYKKDTEKQSEGAKEEPHYFHKWTIEAEKPHNLKTDDIKEKLNFYRFVRSNGRSDDNELLDKIHDLSDELERRKK